MTTIGDIRTT